MTKKQRELWNAFSGGDEDAEQERERRERYRLTHPDTWRHREGIEDAWEGKKQCLG